MDQPTPLQLATETELIEELMSRGQANGAVLIIRNKPEEESSDTDLLSTSCAFAGQSDTLMLMYAFITARFALNGILTTPEELREAVRYWLEEFKKAGEDVDRLEDQEDGDSEDSAR